MQAAPAAALTVLPLALWRLTRGFERRDLVSSAVVDDVQDAALVAATGIAAAFANAWIQALTVAPSRVAVAAAVVLLVCALAALGVVGRRAWHRAEVV